MGEWRPLSVRRGLSAEGGPYSGLPSHIRSPLLKWIQDCLYAAPDSGLGSIVDLGLALGIENPSKYTLLGSLAADEDRVLDVVDFILHTGIAERPEDLAHILSRGNSVWEIGPGGKGLTRRVTGIEFAAAEKAVSHADSVTAELSTAWFAAYGRTPDPSDAWDHAIKAVEAALWPIVTPDDYKATLGRMIERLARQPSDFTFRLATSSRTHSSVEACVEMLRLMWPNPDRHGTGMTRSPTQEEAGNVVQLAVLIAGWVRSGALTRVRPRAE